MTRNQWTLTLLVVSLLAAAGVAANFFWSMPTH